MTTLRTAAQQALEAMDALHRTGDTQVFDLCHRETTEALRAALTEDALQRFTDVNQELEAALAEPVQEPVAWLWQHRETGLTRVLMPDERTATDVAAAWDVVGPLYVAPPQRKPMNEFDALRLATETVGLLKSAGPVEGLIGIIRAVERAHGIT